MEFNLQRELRGAGNGIPTVSNLPPNLIIDWLVSSYEGVSNNGLVGKYFLMFVKKYPFSIRQN